jgi:peptide/nickel transport system substrate-binding protein
MKITPTERPRKNIPRGIFGKIVHVIERTKSSDKLILRGLFFLCVGSLLWSSILISQRFATETPVAGGSIVEGIVGVPRFINPILATTRADLDVVALTFSGLMKISTAGELVPDIAESVTVGDDGTTYRVVLRKDVRFHDDTPLTARDVAYTIGMIQNADLKSPLRGNWMRVTIEEINEYELNIILDEPYAPFIENFTVGILPRHIWSDIPTEQIPFSKHNTEPIGSGPFQLKNITVNESGTIDRYVLKRFEGNGYQTKLAEADLRFYASESDLATAFTNGEITSTAYLPNDTLALYKDNGDYKIYTEPLPRVFGIFFNQNKSTVLRDPSVRKALDAAINRREVVENSLLGFGIPTTLPTPKFDTAVESASNTLSESATTILEKGGWTKNTSGVWEKRIDGQIEQLTITIRTANSPIFESSVQNIARMWRDVGIEVQVEQFEQTDLLQSVIRPRDFEGLLFGIDMSRSVDLYPFWHSSQREDPGLNIAQYANITVDTLLETARTSRDNDVRTKAHDDAVTIITNEQPALFLFLPTVNYIATNELNTTPMTQISKPHERFMNISDWYAATDNLWDIFK